MWLVITNTDENSSHVKYIRIILDSSQLKFMKSKMPKFMHEISSLINLELSGWCELASVKSIKSLGNFPTSNFMQAV